MNNGDNRMQAEPNRTQTGNDSAALSEPSANINPLAPKHLARGLALLYPPETPEFQNPRITDALKRLDEAFAR